MYILGIDPSQRHTGLCLRDTTVSGAPRFYEIQPKEKELYASLKTLQEELSCFLKAFVQPIPPDQVAICIEKQGYAGHSAQTLFCAEMFIIDTIKTSLGKMPKFLSPIPVQLESYLKKVEGLDICSKKSIVDGYKALHGQGRISSHLVEAFYLTKLAEAVLAKSWRYNLSSNEIPRYPWPTINE